MSVEELRNKTERLQTRTRLEGLSWIPGGLLLCAFFGWEAAKAQHLLERIGWGVVSLWVLSRAYYGSKWIRPRELPPVTSLSTSLEFYRRSLESRRDYFRHAWRNAGLTLCFSGLAMVLVPALIATGGTPRLLLNAAPFFTLLSIWFVVFFFTRKRNQRKLQQEIDELAQINS
jgi:hypothetical protein